MQSKQSKAEIVEDRELVKSTLKGDREAYRILFERYYPRVLVSARRILGNNSDAEDISQDAFLKAYRNLKSFKGDSSFYTWIYRILINACIDFKRKSANKYEVNAGDDYVVGTEYLNPLIEEFHAHYSSPEENVYTFELRALISDALNDLTPSHREIIIQREVHGLSYEEIGRLLKCSLGTVMSRLFHARKNLLSLLKDRIELNDGTNPSNIRSVSIG